VKESSLDEGSVEESSLDEAVEDSTKEPCTYCGQTPCDWVAFETEICEECEELVDQKGATKKFISMLTDCILG